MARMRASLTVSGILRRARVRDSISWRDGLRLEDMEIELAGGDAPFVATEAALVSGCGEADFELREVEVMTVVAWRLAGLAVERETFRRRDLNLVRFMSRAAVASSWNSSVLIERDMHVNGKELTLSEKTTNAIPLLFPATLVGMRTLSTFPYFEKI